MEFKLLWREVGPPNHHDDEVDLDQWVVNKGFSHCRVPAGGGEARPADGQAL